MAVIWGSNYSIVKSALARIPPIAFNGVRLTIASALFLLLLALPGVRPRSDPAPSPLGPRSWPALVALAIVGHTLYQLLFIRALDETSVANSSLIIGCTPVFVALMTAALGQERISAARWAGVALSAAGIYLVVGRGAAPSATTGSSLRGDLRMLAAVLCWSSATILSRPLLARHNAIQITGWSMALGTLGYLPFAWREIRAVAWTALAPQVWFALLFSSVLALCVSYIIWYTAIQRLGNTRTAVFSNMVPVAAMLVAWLVYGEPIGPAKVAGATAILAGVALTRV